jgi:hypothetical protein
MKTLCHECEIIGRESCPEHGLNSQVVVDEIQYFTPEIQEALRRAMLNSVAKKKEERRLKPIIAADPIAGEYLKKREDFFPCDPVEGSIQVGILKLGKFEIPVFVDDHMPPNEAKLLYL